MEKYRSAPSLRTFFRSPALPASELASDRLLQGQVYRGRCGEEGGKNAGTTRKSSFSTSSLR